MELKPPQKNLLLGKNGGGQDPHRASKEEEGYLFITVLYFQRKDITAVFIPI
jgi:hypothetical protein